MFINVRRLSDNTLFNFKFGCPLNQSKSIFSIPLGLAVATAQQGRWTNRISSAYRAVASEANTVKPPSRRWVILLAVVCLVAMGVSGYLAWIALTTSKVAGCGGGRLFNCGHVISSRWSLWMGIPVSLLAFGLYTTMGAALWVGASSRFSASIRYMAWTLVTLIGLSAGLAAIWFISLQVFVLKHLCTYCLAAHACGLVTAEVVLWNKILAGKAIAIVSALSVAGMATLIGGQLISEPPATYRIESFEAPVAEPEIFEFDIPLSPGETSDNDKSDKTSMRWPSLDDSQNLVFLFPRSTTMMLTAQLSQTDPPQDDGRSQTVQATDSSTGSGTATAVSPERRFVSINGGTVKLDVAQVPAVGSLKAKYIFVEMFDYACPHCRKTHATIKGASEKLDGDLSVLALPVPLNATCNDAILVTDPKFVESCETARLAVAVWRTDASKFTEFHNWMFTGDQVPNFASAKAYAETLVAAEKLAAELASQVPGQYIAKNVELYKRSGSGNVPKLMFPGTSVIGEFTSVDGLVDVIRREIK